MSQRVADTIGYIADETSQMSKKPLKADEEMRAFCEAVGELVLWTSALDSQLTMAVIWGCALTESPMLEPIVAELDARAKIEILRGRSRHITTQTWSRGIASWADKVEKVNGYRNIVAHHQVVVRDEKFVLYSPQARKVLKNITNLKPGPAKTLADILAWVEAAKRAYEQGQNVLANLKRIAD